MRASIAERPLLSLKHELSIPVNRDKKPTQANAVLAGILAQSEAENVFGQGWAAAEGELELARARGPVY